MVTSTAIESLQDSAIDLKHIAQSEAVVSEYTTNSGQSSLAEGKAFLRISGVDDEEPIDTYEGKHRWDPYFEWQPDEEKRVVRKIDMRICTWVCLSFFCLQLDRANITQALTDNLLPDLGMNTNDYNYGQTMSVYDSVLVGAPIC